MPANKNAFLRYRIIDRCLTNSLHKFPDMRFITEKIERELGTSISDSMFTKDLESMRSLYSAPIKYSRTDKGYHYTEPEFSIREFPLSHEEIEALDFSTALLQQLKNTPMFHHFETAINKVIEGYRISKDLGKSETQLLQVEEPVRTGGDQWLDPLLKAIINKQCLSIMYHGFGRPEKEHLFSPYLLKEYRNRWYAVGHSDKAKNILVLALDRVTLITQSKNKFVLEPDFTPADYFRYSFGITQLNEARPEKVELLFTPAQAPYILSQPLHHSQLTVSDNAFGLHVTMEVYLTQELVMSILSYADQVKVLRPAKLQKQIRQHIISMVRLYEIE